MKTLEEYYEESEKKCRWCKGKLSIVNYYPHTAGWDVDSFTEKQWLYKTCLECGYDWALWKIGVPRN